MTRKIPPAISCFIGSDRCREEVGVWAGSGFTDEFSGETIDCLIIKANLSPVPDRKDADG
jgi:hypothetical protein